MSFLESCSTEEICTSFGASEKLLNQLRNELEDWLKLQPHLPQGASDKKLESFILGSKMSLEVAKQKLDLYYTMRGRAPELFADTDPRAPDLAAVYNVSHHVLLPKLTPEKCAISIFQSLTNDSSMTDPWQISKHMFMMTEIQMDECRCLGHIYVFDLAMMTLSHLKRITPTLLQKNLMATKAYPFRIKGIHCINTPSYVGSFISMLKSVLSEKLAARVHVHTTDNLDSFYRFVPKSILPKDYGGDQSTMNELSDMWRDKLEEWRDRFLEQNTIFVDESLRPSSSVNKNSLFGFDGSFRKLDLD